MALYDLHYHCQNCGDGSATVEFHKTKKEAQKADKAQEEYFSEETASSVKIKVEDGKVFFGKRQFNGKKYEYVWIELKESKS